MNILSVALHPSLSVNFALRHTAAVKTPCRVEYILHVSVYETVRQVFAKIVTFLHFEYNLWAYGFHSV